MIATGKRFTMIHIFSGPLVHLILAKLTEAANNPDSKVVCALAAPEHRCLGVQQQLPAGTGQRWECRRATLWVFSPHQQRLLSTEQQNWACSAESWSPLVSKLIYLTVHGGVFTGLTRLQRTHISLILSPGHIYRGSQSSWLTKPGCPPAFVTLFPTSRDKRRTDILPSALVTVTAFGSSLLEQQNTSQKRMARL